MMYELQNYQSLFDAVYRQTNDADYFTVKGWRSRSREVRQILQQIKVKHDEMLEGLKRVYSEELLAKTRANLDGEYNEALDVARSHIRNDINAVLSEKRKRFDAAHAAPTQDQINLLQVLSMRSKVEPGEVIAVVPQMAGNLQALRLLSEIADKSGVYFPSLPTEADFERDVEIVKDWGRYAAEDVALTDDESGYSMRVFWADDTYGEIAPAQRGLDSPSYLDIDSGSIRQVGGGAS